MSQFGDHVEVLFDALFELMAEQGMSTENALDELLGRLGKRHIKVLGPWTSLPGTRGRGGSPRRVARFPLFRLERDVALAMRAESPVYWCVQTVATARANTRSWTSYCYIPGEGGKQHKIQVSSELFTLQGAKDVCDASARRCGWVVYPGTQER